MRDAAGNFAGCGLGTLPLTGLSATSQRVGEGLKDQFQKTGATAGTCTIARTGSTVTATATSGDDSTTVTGEVGTGELLLSLALGNNHPSDALGGASSVRVRAVTITGGGERVGTDDFACDSLVR